MTSLTNSPTREHVLRLEYRQSFGLNVVFTDDDALPFDLTGCTLRFDMAKPSYLGGANVISRALTIVDAAAGKARLDLQSDDIDVAVLGVAEGEFPYVLTLLTAQSYSIVLMKGTVDVAFNADSLVSSDYSPVALPETMTARLRDNHLVSIKINRMPAALVSPADIGAASAISPERYGALANGTNDTAAIQAALDAAAANGGGVVQLTPGKRYGWNGILYVRAGVTLQGGTTRQNLAPNASPTVPGLVALSANAQLFVGGGTGLTPGGVSNLHVDGNFIGGNPAAGYKGLVQITGVNVSIDELFAVRSASDGIVFYGTQNSTIVGGSSTFHVGCALVLDGGPGALAFLGGYYGTSKGGALDMRSTTGYSAYPFGPTQNTWTGTIFEAYPGQAAPIAEPYAHHVHISGRNNLFSGCNFTAGAQNSDAAAMLIDSTVSLIASSTIFDSCMWWTRQNHDAIRIIGSQSVSFVGQQTVYDDGTNHALSFCCLDTGFPSIDINGNLEMSGTNDGSRAFRTINGASLVATFGYKDGGTVYRLRSGQVVGWRRPGDSGHRAYIDQDGVLAWFDGTSGLPKGFISGKIAGNGIELSTSGPITQTGAQVSTPTDGSVTTVGATLTLPTDISADARYAMSANATITTLNMPAGVNGQRFRLCFVTATGNAVTWPANIVWANGGAAPALAASAFNWIDFEYFSTTSKWVEIDRAMVVGTTAGTVAAGNDSRITGAAADSLVMHLAGTETATGAKNFNSNVYFGASVRFALAGTLTSSTLLNVNSRGVQPCDATTGPFTVTLPATTSDGQLLWIKKIDTSANPVTIAGTSIDGSASVVLYTKDEWVLVCSTTTSGTWRVLGRSSARWSETISVSQPYKAYTSAGGLVQIPTSAPGGWCVYNSGTAINDSITYRGEISSGTWTLRQWYVAGSNAGIAKIEYSLDEGATWFNVSASVDMYAAAPAAANVDKTGIVVINQQTILVRTTILGKNASSSAYYFLLAQTDLTRTS